MNGGENSDFDGSTNSGTQNPEHQRHSVIGSRRYHGPSDEQKYAAATDLANNPNTPDFFSEAVMANTEVPQPRKSHKGIIISTIGIIVVGIIAAVCIFVFATKSNTTKNAVTSFQSLSNYILFGENKNDSIPEDISINDYEMFAIEEKLKTDNISDKETYFNNLETMVASFEDNYPSLKENHKIDEKYYDSVENFINRVKLIIYIAKNDRDTKIDIANLATHSKYDDIRQYIDGVFENELVDKSPFIERYLKIKKEYYIRQLEYVKICTDNKCDYMSSDIDICIAKKGHDAYEKLINNNEELKDYTHSLEDYPVNTIHLLVGELIELNKAMTKE